MAKIEFITIYMFNILFFFISDFTYIASYHIVTDMTFLENQHISLNLQSFKHMLHLVKLHLFLKEQSILIYIYIYIYIYELLN